MIGDRLGTYRIVSSLGKGGMGEVWVAEDTRLDRRVALKTLPPEMAGDPQYRARFAREAKAVASLNHPNIVTIHSVEEADGISFITMELVEGRALTELVPEDGLPWSRLLDVAVQLADAVAAAHAKGITHRDLKPDNVMINDEGRLKVLDFGLAKFAMTDVESRRAVLETATQLQATREGTLLGTVAYMSPEQAEGRPVDARSDVFALGVILFELAAGRRPFGGETPAALIASILRDAPPSLADVRPELPSAFGDAVAACLEKNFDRRLPSAAELRDRLSTIRTDTSDAAGDGTKRRPAVQIAVAVVAIAAVAIGAWFVARLVMRDPATPPAGAAVSAPATPHISQLTFEVEPEMWPSWSPDGSRLAYCREIDGFSKLFVKDLATGEVRQLTHEERDHIQPAWSPDGRHLAFVRAGAERGQLEPGDALIGAYSGGDVWLLEMESGESRMILEDAFNPSFSPDGTRIAVDSSWAGPRRIWTTDARGRNPRQITTGTSEATQHIRPDWSPDGVRLVYQHRENTKLDIRVVEIATGETLAVTDDAYLDLDPVWAESGGFIYMASYRGGGLNIWRVPVGPDGAPVGPLRQLTTGAGQDIAPSLTRDGMRLAFAVLQQNADLWRLPVDPASGRRVGDPEPLVASTREDSRGAWSPDGDRVAFNSDRDGDMNIWVHSLVDGSTVPITRGPGGDYQPAWSPDGSSIAFFSARSGNADVWIVDVDSRELRQVTDHPALDTNPFFSPDGTRIAFQSDRDGRKEAWLVDLRTGDVRQAATVGAADHFMRWSADGETLWFRSTALPENSIYRLSVADGRGEPTGLPAGWHMSFSPDGRLVLDVLGHHTLVVLPLDGSPAREIYTSESASVRIDYPEWSPDGTSVVFDRVVPQGADVWLLDGLE